MLKAEPPIAAERWGRLNPGGRGLGLLLTVTLLTLSLAPAAAANRAHVSAPDGLNLRDAPSTAGNVLQLLPLDTSVDVVGDATADGWVEVNVAGRLGYVNGAYLDSAPPLPLRGSAIVTPPDGVHLRADPSLGGGIVALLSAGRVVHISGDPTSDGWYPVSATEGSGWIDGAYLQATGDGAVPVTIRWYGHEFDGGVLACGGQFHADDVSVAATNGWPCGTHLKVCAVGRCVAVTVQDRGHMGAGAMDLSAGAFQHLASLDTGALNGTLQVYDDTSAQH